MIIFSPKKSFSHALILVSTIISIIGFIKPEFQWQYAFSPNALSEGIVTLVMQTALFQFLHGNILHLLANSYFLYSAGPSLEARMTKNQFFYFFITTTIFLAMALLIFAEKNTVTLGISGFCSALLSYLFVDLYTTKHPDAMEMGTLLVINILIGFSAQISFVGHFFGAVWGVIYWYILRKKWRFLS